MGMKKILFSLFVWLLLQLVMVGMSALWTRWLSFENWHYLGAWLYFAPVFWLSYGSSFGGGLAASPKFRYQMSVYIAVTFVSFLVRDALIGESFYLGWEWVYGGFFSYALAATGVVSWLRGVSVQQKNNKKSSFTEEPEWTLGFKALGVLLGSFGFFLISNFGVWWQGSLYTHDWEGFLQCYWRALPFLKTTLSSDLVFSFFFCALAALLERGLEKLTGRKSFVIS